MFTGLIETTGAVVGKTSAGDMLRLDVEVPTTVNETW